MKKAFIGATFSLLLVVIAAFSWYVFFLETKPNPWKVQKDRRLMKL